MKPQTVKFFADLHDPAQPFAISRVPPHTLADLIGLIQQREGNNHQFAMMKATAGHIADYFAKDASQIPINDLLDLRPRLKLYLEDRQYKRNAVRSYTNYLRILIRKAMEFGCNPRPPEIAKSWQEILTAIKGTRSRRIVDYAIRKGMTPAEFTDEDLNNWANEELNLGRQYEYVRHLRTTLAQRIARAGLSGRIPNLSIHCSPKYGFPFHHLPEQMRAELTTLLEWKTAPFAVGRSNKSRHRPITALHLRRFVCRLFGFVHNVLGKKVSTVRGLFKEEYVGRFAEWCVNQRKLATPSLASWLGMIPPLGEHRLLKRMDLTYIRKLVAALPIDPEDRIRERKRRKWVTYDKLARIPDEIQEVSERVKDPKGKALLARNALIVKWLLVAPWRQLNVREARMGTQDSMANVFYDEIPPLSTMDTPPWVDAALRKDPHANFWQFHFSADETKNGRSVQAILPQPLIKPLEEYLTHWRPQLVSGRDPNTLFLNDHGHPYTKARFTSLVSGIAFRHTHRRATPHLFRDIFAVTFLKVYTEAYLSLSKILGHRNVATTILICGRNFDES